MSFFCENSKKLTPLFHQYLLGRKFALSMEYRVTIKWTEFTELQNRKYLALRLRVYHRYSRGNRSCVGSCNNEMREI